MSTALTVTRYTALATGVFYGIWHRQSLQKSFNESKVNAELKKREHWVQEAKEAWEAKKAASKNTLVTDPDAPGFDLEAIIKAYEL